jgi:hypothetical protein
MTDKKISQLTGATTPLAGTEEVPLVQGGTTKKVTVANLTAGRTVDATTVNATTVDATNVEVTNVKAKDGTAAVTIADSTGAVTVSSGSTLNGGVVVNETGVNVDFRVEGDTDTNLLFVDASADQVGIGTASPGQKLEIAGNVRLSGSEVGSKIENRVNAINVSTATNILDAAGSYGRLVVVNGYNVAGRFCDLVFASTSVSPTVIASFTALGSPAARTYTRSGSALQLAMASGTYEIHALALGY